MTTSRTWEIQEWFLDTLPASGRSCRRPRSTLATASWHSPHSLWQSHMTMIRCHSQISGLVPLVFGLSCLWCLFSLVSLLFGLSILWRLFSLVSLLLAVISLCSVFGSIRGLFLPYIQSTKKKPCASNGFMLAGNQRRQSRRS